MWTEQSRGRMAKIAKKTKRYPSDLTDEEWEAIAPLMPEPGRRGRPREVEFREVISGALSGPFGLRLAHAAGPLRALADGLRLVPRVGAAVPVPDHPCKRWPWVKHLFADGAYDRLKLMDKAAYLD